MAMTDHCQLQFPCSIELRIPLPTARLAAAALHALQVDAELSPLVRRHLFLDSAQDLLHAHYAATTNRMLRITVNSFMDSLTLVLDVIQHLDVSVLAHDAT